MSGKAYPHYKPSGVEWPGDMPLSSGDTVMIERGVPVMRLERSASRE